MMGSVIWLITIFLLLPWSSSAVFFENGDGPESRQHPELEMKLDSFSEALKSMEAKVSRISEENQECKLANERMAIDFKLANEVMANDFKQDMERMAKANERMATDIQQLKIVLHSRNRHVNFMPKVAGDLGRGKRQAKTLRSPSIPNDLQHQKEPMLDEGMEDSAETAENVDGRNQAHEYADSRKKTQHMEARPESVPRTCEELRNRGINISGAYLIDPDGHGIGDPPMMAQCLMTETSGTTLIHHDTLGQRDVQHCEGPGCHAVSITYEASHKQIIALSDLSETCTQTITYRCFSAPLKTEDQVMAWWTGLRRNPESADTAINNFYWDGNHNSTEHFCHCHLDDSCIMNWLSSSIPNHCNCDAGARQWATDEGTLTNKAQLPVTELRFGGLTSEHQMATFELGAFACSGNNQEHQIAEEFGKPHPAVLLATGTSDQQRSFSDASFDLILSNHPIASDPSGAGARKVRSLPDDNPNQQQPAEFIFDLPDLVTTQQTDGGVVQLEAFPARGNKAILSNTEAEKAGHSQLRWVSIGYPRIVKSIELEEGVKKSHPGKITPEPPQEERLFHFTPEGIHTRIEMLTAAQKELLARQASKKYGVEIDPKDQVIPLSLSQFQCSLLIVEPNGEKLMLLRGEVSDFSLYPLRMDFEAPLGSKGRRVFEDRLGRDDSGQEKNVRLTFKCKLATAGKLEKTNVLKITSKQFQKMGITEELFGPANSKYVTRHQLDELATRIYSNLDILEEYEMPEHQFSEAFLQGLFTEAITAQFSDVPIRDAVADLSRFSTKFDKDLQPDEIVKDLGSLFRVEKDGNKSHIVANRDHFSSSKTGDKVDVSYAGKADVLGLVSAAVSLDVGLDKQREKANHDKSLDDQLRELNRETQNAVTWAIEGSKVIPRSLNVARLSRTSFEKTISFKRIRREFRRAEFTKSTALYVEDRLAGKHSIFTNIQTMIKGVEDSVLCLQKLDIRTRLESAENLLHLVETRTSELMKWKEEMHREQNKLRNKKDWDSTESCRTLLESGHTAPGYYWVDGPGGTNYHLVKCNMNLNPSDPGFQITTSAKLSEFPVAFDFYRDSGGSFSKGDVPIPYQNFHINDGNGMTLNGTFTVPLDGVYFFSFTGYAGSGTIDTIFEILVDGKIVSSGIVDTDHDTDSGTVQVLLALKNNQKVYTHFRPRGRIYNSGTHSHFIGVLMYPL